MSQSVRASDARVQVQREINSVNAAKHAVNTATDLRRVPALELVIEQQEQLVMAYAKLAKEERLRAEAAERKVAELSK